MHKFNWNKFLNIILIVFCGLIVGAIVGIALLFPVASVKASETLIDGVYFVSGTTNVRRGTYSNSTYVYNFNSATDYISSNDYPTLLSSKISQSISTNGVTPETYEEIDYSDSIYQKTTSDYYIPRNAEYYTYNNLNTSYFNALPEIFYSGQNYKSIFSNTYNNGDLILLNNSNLTNDSLYELENMYLGFGDVDNSSTIINSLSVSATLSNTDGIHYVKVNNPVGYTINSATSYYWYNYFDLSRVEYVQADNMSTNVFSYDTEGQYTISIRYTVTTNANTSAPTTYTNQTYSYTFYLMNADSYYSTPSASENFITGNSTTDAITHYYYTQASNDEASFSYDLNKYTINYDYTLNNVISNYTTSFSSKFYDSFTFYNEENIITTKNNVWLNTLNIFKNGSTSPYKSYSILGYQEFGETTLISDNDYYILTQNNYYYFDGAVTSSATPTVSPFRHYIEGIKKTYTLLGDDEINTQYYFVEQNVFYNGTTYSIVDFSSTPESTENNISYNNKYNYFIKSTNNSSLNKNIFDYNFTFVFDGLGQYEIYIYYNAPYCTTISPSSGIVNFANSITYKTLTNIDYNPTNENIATNYTANEKNQAYYTKLTAYTTTDKLLVNYTAPLTSTTSATINGITYSYSGTTLSMRNNGTSSTLSTALSSSNNCYTMYINSITDGVVSIYGKLSKNTTGSTQMQSSALQMLYRCTTAENLQSAMNKYYSTLSSNDVIYSCTLNFETVNDVQTLTSITISYLTGQITTTYRTEKYTSKETFNPSNTIEYNYYDYTTTLFGLSINTYYPTYYTKDDVIITKDDFVENHFITDKSLIDFYFRMQCCMIGESYTDANENEQYDEGETFTDINGDGIYNGELYKLEKISRSYTVEQENFIKKTSPISNIIELDIIGSKAYFNKDNSSNDKYELKQSSTSKKADFTPELCGGTTNIGANFTYPTLETGTDWAIQNHFSSIISTTDNTISSQIITTNLCPVYLNYYGSYCYNGITPLSKIYRYSNYVINSNGTITLNSVTSTNYLNKDTYFADNGLYLVIVRYTYDLMNSQDYDSNSEFIQVFAFIINNSSPSVTLEKYDTTSSTWQDMGSNPYTNEKVRISWQVPTYFQSNITAKITSRAYDKTIRTENVSYSRLSEINTTGNYLVKVYYGVDSKSYITYNFIIDRTSISPQTRIVNVTESGAELSYSYEYTSSDSFRLTNLPFTIIYPSKASGAKITAKYYQLSFANTNEGIGNLYTSNGDYLVSTGQYLNGANATNSLQYTYYYNQTYGYNNVTSVNTGNYFNPSTTTIYRFELYDQAGNTCSYYVIYDNSTPQFDYDCENSYGIISDTTNLTWGDYKALKITNASNISTISTFINNNSVNYGNIKIADGQLIGSSTTNTFLLIPLNYVNSYSSDDYNEITTINTSTYDDFTMFTSSNSMKSVIGSTTTTSKYNSSSYILSYNYNSSTKLGAYGERKYYFTLYDTIGNSGIVSFWMNLDRVQGMIYNSYTKAYDGTMNSMNNIIASTDDEVLTNAAQTYFSFKSDATADDSTTLEFEISYKYYDFDFDFYEDLLSGNYEYDTTSTSTTYKFNHKTDSTKSITITIPDNDEPFAFYPFALNSSFSKNDLQNDTNDYSIDGKTFTNIINPNGESGTTMTKQGLYIFKRQYTNVTANDIGEDIMTRYYVYSIDRQSIIDITNYLSIGEDISFDLGTINKTTITSTQLNNIQTTPTSAYSNNESKISNLFVNATTNKTEVLLNLPDTKYNYDSIFNIATDKLNIDNYQTTIQAILNKIITQDNSSIYKRYTIQLDINDESNTYMSNGQKNSSSTLTNILKTKSFNGTARSNEIAVSNNGKFTYTIKDLSGYEFTNNNNLVTNNNPNNLEIKFTINHSYAESTLKGKNYNYLDTNTNVTEDYLTNNINKYTDLTVNQESNATKSPALTTYSSTNNNTLLFVFQETFTNTDKENYNAKIDPNNITIKRDGTIIYQKKNGSYIVNSSGGNYDFEYNYNGEKYFAISIYDFLSKEENNLVKKSTITSETVFSITYQYYGNEENYITQNANTTTNYFKNTVSITYDSIKPEYNLTKLMLSDTYTHNNAKPTSYLTTYSTAETFVDKNANGKYDEGESYTDSNGNKSYDAEINIYHTSNDNLRTTFNTYYSYYEDLIHSTFFRISSDFTFNSVNNLDSTEIYYRKISSESSYPSDYLYSITPDQFEIYNSSTLSSHPRFSLNDTNYSSRSYEAKQINASTLFNTSYGYYEIIEKDEAGNYRVYGILYTNKNTDTIGLSYDLANETNNESDTIIDGFLGYQNADNTYYNNLIVCGTNLKLHATSNLNSTYYYNTNNEKTPCTNYKLNDYALKLKLTTSFNNSVVYFINDPSSQSINITGNFLTGFVTNYSYSDLNVSNDYDEAVTKYFDIVNNYISAINDASNASQKLYGYNIYLEFYTRYTWDTLDTTNPNVLKLTYKTPGKFLDLKFTDHKQENYFTVYVPFDTELSNSTDSTTTITSMTVQKYNDGWETLNTDINGYTFNVNLPGKTFTFSSGLYCFHVRDNFSREIYVYYSFGQSSLTNGYNVSYSGASIYDTSLDTTYTSNATTFEYDNTIYKVYMYDLDKTEQISVNGTTQTVYQSISLSGYNTMYGINVSSTNNITKIYINSMNDKIYNYELKCVLVNSLSSSSGGIEYYYNLESTDSNVSVKSFKITLVGKLPTLQTLNLNNKSIIIDEDIVYSSTFRLFYDSTKLNISNGIEYYIIGTRTYTNTSGNKTTETIKVASNDYRIEKGGLYKLKLTNNLGLESTEIIFTRSETDIILYSVIKTDSTLNTTEMVYSSDKKEMYDPSGDTTINETYKTCQRQLLIHYFVTDDYQGSTTKKVEIRTNENAGMSYRLMTEEVQTNSSNGTKYEIYMIYSGNLDNPSLATVYRYIQINYVPLNSDFLNSDNNTAYSTGSNLNYTTSSNSKNTNINYYTIKSTNDEVYINYPAYYKDPYNITIVEYYYNNQFVKYVNSPVNSSSVDSKMTSITLSKAGYYKLIFKDLAGNNQNIYGAYNYLNVIIVNDIIYTINNNTPIDNEIFNNSVTLQIINSLAGNTLYEYKQITATVTRNGVAEDYSLTNGKLVLNKQGYYSIKLSTTININDIQKVITSSYEFTIIDPEIAVTNFNISNNKNFTITSLKKEGTSLPISNNMTSLWLSTDENSSYGSGNYTVTLSYYNSILEQTQNFSFQIWINDETPTIISTTPFGTSTKDDITLTYNPYLIYNQLGKSYITLNGEKIATIDSSCTNALSTTTITKAGTYWVQIYSEDGTLISSYKVEKLERLNTITIILIVIGSVMVVVLVFIFVKLRKRAKVR